MLKIDCDVCEQELNEQAALFYGPPVDKRPVKYHLCKSCWEVAYNFLFAKKREEFIINGEPITVEWIRRNASVATGTEDLEKMNNIPRRIDILRNTPAELAIRKAVEEVEMAGCHPLLTEAVVLLDKAREKVADFVDLPK